MTGLTAMHRRRPLRHRLIALMLAVVTTVLLITVVASMTLVFRILSGERDQRLDAALAGGSGYTDVTLQIVDVAGRTRAILQTRSRGPAVPATEAAAAAVRAGHPVTASGPDGAWRLSARPRPDGTWLLAAQPIGGEGRLHDRLAVIWCGTVLVILLITAGLTRHLIGYGLRPLTAVAREATRIHAGDLTRRLPAGTADEIGQLAAALNGMLDRVQAALHERQQADERLRRFVDDAGHELRTPVTAIRGWADLYERGAVPDIEVSTAMRRIRQETERVGSLVDQLLQLASLDQPAAGRVGPDDRRNVDLAEIVRDAVLDARAVDPDRPITTDLPRTGTAPVCGDAMALHQVVANLLANIRAHTPPGTPARLHVQHQVAGGDRIVLRVSDDGPGVPAEMRDKVFDRFFRADPARAHRGSTGAGLGLSIVAAIVADHGGDIRAEPGDGFTVRISLPAARPASTR
ncbi:HAMP domain-containing sensor histidine kinase [Actinoplanes sp. NPDC023801]|uniref:sensor histidine kinase n=1 Tax=Actinoplanes sp. NPDC023801 TaxID=3154595 RepID=UPI0033CB3B7D